MTIYIYEHTQNCSYICVYTHIHTHIHAQTYIKKSTHIHAYTHSHIYIYIYAYAYTYTHPHTYTHVRIHYFNFISLISFESVSALLRITKINGFHSKLYIKKRAYTYTKHKESEANELDCDTVVCEFELHSRYYIHFQINTLGKSINPLIPPPQAMH